MDIVTSEQRSKNMAAICSKDTKPEVYFRKLLFAKGYRYSLNSKNVPGHPDIYLRKYNTAVFIHGCFWHRHKDCKFAYMPKSKVVFWQNKFETNQKRDFVVKNELQKKKIKCLVIWECSIKKMKKDEEFEDSVIIRVRNFLVSHNLSMEI
ncbi:MAG: very short patch repair endonuclease [Lachnospira sp.]